MELGAAFDRAMQVYVFDPLSMRDTTMDFDPMAIRKRIVEDILIERVMEAKDRSGSAVGPARRPLARDNLFALR